MSQKKDTVDDILVHAMIENLKNLVMAIEEKKLMEI